jgi:adenine/guanine phosphoribosyltransferase-like PRPP-binding protein
MKRARFKYTTRYLSSVYNTPLFIKKVNQVVRKIKAFQKRNRIDAIAFTGHSGCAFAYTLSYKLSIPLVCIRKKPEKSHFNGLYEGRLNVRNYIIVDDFIDTGKTIEKIQSHVKIESPEAKLLAIFLYGGCFNEVSYKDIPVFDLKYIG